MSLTPKQELFVQGIVSGLSQREAYKQAYNTAKMKDNTIDIKASELFNNGKVTVRYQELVEEYKEEAVYSRLEMEADLIWVKEKARSDIEKKGIRQANGSIFVNAIKELGELNELYPSKKQEIKLDGNVEASNPMEGLTTDELKILASMGDKDG